MTERQKGGHVALEKLRGVPSGRERITEGRKPLAKPVRGRPSSATVVEHLARALSVESETAACYRRMTSDWERACTTPRAGRGAERPRKTPWALYRSVGLESGGVVRFRGAGNERARGIHCVP